MRLGFYLNTSLEGNKLDTDKWFFLFNTLADAGSGWVCWFDENKSLRYISQGFERSTGYSLGEIKRNRDLLVEIIYRDDINQYKNHIKNLFEDTNTHAFKFRIVKKDGETLWIEHKCSPIYTEDGVFLGRLVTNTDINFKGEGKEEEEVLNSPPVQAEILKKIIESLNGVISLEEIYNIVADGVIELLGANGVAVSVFGEDGFPHIKVWRGFSDPCLRFLDGYSPWEMKAGNALPLCFPHVMDSSLDERIKTSLLADGVRAFLVVPIKGNGGLVGEFMISFDVPHECSFRELQLLEILSHHVAIIISGRRSREMAERSELMYRSIFENATEGIYQTTVDGRIVTVNPAMARMFGYSSPEEMMSLEDTSQLYWDASDRKRLIEIGEKEGGLYNIEVKMRRIDGKPIWVLMNDRAVRNQRGEFLYYEGTLLDITKRKEIEEALRESEERLRLLINSTPDIICFKDGRGRWLEANEADLELFSLKGINYRGKTDLELASLTDPIYRDAFLTCKETDDKTWESGKVFRGEEIIPQSDGSNKVYDVIKVPVFDSRGNRKGLVVLGRDITELKRAQENLCQQLIFSQALNKISKSIIFETERDKILKAMVQIAGDTLCVDRCLIYRVDRKKREAQALSEWLSSGKGYVTPSAAIYPLGMFARSERYIWEKRTWLESYSEKVHPLIASEGSAELLHQELEIKSLLWFPFAFEGEKYYLLVFNHVKQPHRWENAEISFVKSLAGLVEIALMKIRFLEEKEESAAAFKRLATVVEQSSEAIVVTDLEGRVEYVNPAFERITGYSASDVMGREALMFRNARSGEKFYETLLDTVLRGEVWRGRWNARRKDGSEYKEEAVVFPIKDAYGKIVNFCKIARDVSREAELESQLQQAQKMEALGTLAGGIAHDFNNLLTVINGYSDMLLMELDKDNPVYEDVRVILETSKKAENLTRQLLTFSRREVQQPEVVDLNQIVRSMEKMIRRLIDEDISIEIALKESLPKIKGDRTQIEQIVINLVVNARDAIRSVRKANFPGRIKIETGETLVDDNFILQYPDVQKGLHVFLIVSDNGIGMDRETREKIFEPFFTTKEKFKGTGLGLSVVYGIVKQNNGCILVDSEPGKGTIFKIYWPATTEGERNSVSGFEREDLSGDETILVVEDDSGVREFVVRALGSLGYRVYHAQNGRDALELIKSKGLQIDLLITDLVMPEMNGKDLADRICVLFPGIKIIFVSGYTNGYIMDKTLLGENIDFVQKPYSVKSIARKVREVLDVDNSR